jgi:glycosyltransferase involved in cell wall biosynthesis
LVKAGIKGEDISVLPNAVDPELFSPREPDQELSSKLQLSRFAATLVYTGTLTEYEGVDVILSAMALLNARSVNVKLILVGSGPYEAELRQIIERLRLSAQVTFVVKVSPKHIPSYLSLANVVALPRKAFGVSEVVSPLKPFEAMAMEKPVILSDVAASREIVQDGVTGLLCKPSDAEDLSRKIRMLIDNPSDAARIASNGRSWVLQHRTWAGNARLLRERYSQLTGAPSPARPEA